MENLEQRELYQQYWASMSQDARTVAKYLSHLEPTVTHSDPDTLKSYLGMEEEGDLEKALNELSQRDLLTYITYRHELEKVSHGGSSEIAPPPFNWSPAQAANRLEPTHHAPENSVLDYPHYQLKPEFKKFVQAETIKETVAEHAEV